jgi:L-iditol 2-dehydrogenase
LHEFSPPHPGPGALLIEIKCALSCGTDLKTYRRGHPMWKLPAPFGHEFSGVVAEVGAGVEQFKLGDAIMAAPTAPCGACFYCDRGQENLCPQGMDLMVMGAYADYLLLPPHVVARNTFKKPPALSFEEAALLEPLACVVHAHEMARPEKSETVLIVGAGPFGLLHMMALKAAGVREIAIAGRGESRLKWAGDLGADQVIDVTRSDAAEAAGKLNGGYGPDLVIECTGQVAGWYDAFARVRRGGRVVFFGGCPVNTAVSIDTRRMHYDNLTLLAPFHFRPHDVRRACDLLSGGSLGAGRIINARRSLSELGEVFAMLERGTVLKCAVIP